MGMRGNENSTFSHFQAEEENQPVSGATSASPGTSECVTVISDVDYYSTCVFNDCLYMVNKFDFR